MAQFNNFTLTNLGIALMAKVKAGATLTLSTFRTGSGDLSTVTDLKTLTSLLAEKQSFGFSSKVVSGNVVKLAVNINNTNLTTGYALKEGGIYATDPDAGEILFAVAGLVNATDYDTIPAYADNRAVVITEEILMTTSDASSVTITTTQSALVTAEDLAALKAVVSAYTMTAAGWASSAYSFESLYPASTYDIEIQPNGDSITADQMKAWNNAKIYGSATANKAIAKGTAPEVDIPVILKVVHK